MRKSFLDSKQWGLLSILCHPGYLEIHSVGFIKCVKVEVNHRTPCPKANSSCRRPSVSWEACTQLCLDFQGRLVMGFWSPHRMLPSSLIIIGSLCEQVLHFSCMPSVQLLTDLCSFRPVSRWNFKVWVLESAVLY